MQKIVLGLTTSSTIGLHGYGNSVREASQAWRAMGNDGFGVGEIRGSNPGGPPLWWCQFQMRRHGQLRLMQQTLTLQRF